MVNRLTISLLLASTLIGALAWAQLEDSKLAQDDVPKAALLSDRGSKLAERLRNLRQSEAKYGSKHPALPGVKAEIESVLEALKSFAPGQNPFPGAEVISKPVQQLSETELREIVIRLSTEVDNLKVRVQELEKSKR